MTNIDLCRGWESKELAGAVDGSLYYSFGYTMVVDCWRGGWGVRVEERGLTVEEADVDAGRAYLGGECAIQDRIGARRVLQVTGRGLSQDDVQRKKSKACMIGIC